MGAPWLRQCAATGILAARNHSRQESEGSCLRTAMGPLPLGIHYGTVTVCGRVPTLEPQGFVATTENV